MCTGMCVFCVSLHWRCWKEKVEVVKRLQKARG